MKRPGHEGDQRRPPVEPPLVRELVYQHLRRRLGEVIRSGGFEVGERLYRASAHDFCSQLGPVREARPAVGVLAPIEAVP